MSFEPFAVQCTTCASRLRVTDPAVVGTIASCPKCHSMVEIARPQPKQQVAVGSPQVDSEAITEEAIAAGSASEFEPPDVPSGFGGQMLDTAPSGQSAADHAPAIGGPLPPTWESSRTQRSRHIALVVALAGSGLIAAVLMFTWFVKNWPAENEASTQPTVSAPEHSNQPDSQSPKEPSAVQSDRPQGNAESSALDPSANQPKTADPDAADPEAADPEVSEMDAGIEQGPNDANSDRDAMGDQQPTVVQPSEIKTNVKPPSDLLTDSMLDPLGLNEPTQDKSFPGGDDKQPNPADGQIDLSTEVRKFADMLDLQGEADAPKLDAPATIDDLKIEGPTNENIDPMMIANPPEPINFKRALAIKVALAITKKDRYPLSDLTLLLSQVSGVPIQIDWVSFDLVGVNIRDGVSGLKGKGKLSIDEWLNFIAESVGGEITRSETLVTLAPAEELFQEKLATLLDTSDLGAGQATATATVNELLVGKPQGGVSTKRIKVGDQRYDQQLAALAVEAMRRMRGVPGKIDNAVLQRWAQAASDPQLDWPLVSGGQAGKPLLSPLTMAGFLRRMARQNDATCFINWDDANRRGMAPQQLVMPFMGAKAGEVLKFTLQPFELQVRRVDRTHWWVGTEATYDRFPVIVWTDSLGKKQDRFVKRINQIDGGDDVKLSIDADTQKALLLLPRYIVRQMPKLLDDAK